MAKITKQAAFLEQLHSMVTKEASAGKATGKPGGDTHPVSVSKETEHVDKNKEGHPEHNPQEFKQEPAKDPSDPTKTHKKAEEAVVAVEAEKQAAAAKSPAADQMPGTALKAKAPAKEAANSVEQKEAAFPADLKAANKKHEAAETPAAEKAEHKVASTHEKLAELGEQLIAAVAELNKQANAGTATGKPGGDTHPVSVSEATEHVNKNEQGKPEHNPQEFKQEAAKDPSDPTKTHHKAAEQAELDKEASFELGRQFARTFLMSKTASHTDMYKEAGRRDFESLIAQAAAELENDEAPKQEKQAAAAGAQAYQDMSKQAAAEELQVKQAEEAGAQAFYAMAKQAQAEEQANQVKLAYEQQYNQLLAEKQAAEKKNAELAAKLAEHELAIQKQAEEAKLDMKFASWGSRVVDEVISRLKSEPLK